MEMVGMIRPTSKAALKSQCLILCNLDVDKAEKMYNFLIKDIADIPDMEAASKSFMQNFGEQATGVIDWFRGNQDMIERGVGFVQDIIARRKGGVAPTPAAAPLPPLE